MVVGVGVMLEGQRLHRDFNAVEIVVEGSLHGCFAADGFASGFLLRDDHPGRGGRHGLQKVSGVLVLLEPLAQLLETAVDQRVLWRRTHRPAWWS